MNSLEINLLKYLQCQTSKTCDAQHLTYWFKTFMALLTQKYATKIEVACLLK